MLLFLSILVGLTTTVSLIHYFKEDQAARLPKEMKKPSVSKNKFKLNEKGKHLKLNFEDYSLKKKEDEFSRVNNFFKSRVRYYEREAREKNLQKRDIFFNPHYEATYYPKAGHFSRKEQKSAQEEELFRIRHFMRSIKFKAWVREKKEQDRHLYQNKYTFSKAKVEDSSDVLLQDLLKLSQPRGSSVPRPLPKGTPRKRISINKKVT